MTEQSPDARVKDLVLANRLLVHHNILDGFGHVSVRTRSGVERFFLARSMPPALVTASDILEFDLDANTVSRSEAKPYLERFIHGEIYRLRPDVNAIVHSHAQSVLPFTLVKGVHLCPMCHMAGFIANKATVFEIRDFAGDGSDLLIRNRELGAELARTLGGEAVVLMRGHGMTVVGPTIPQAVFRSVYTDVNARIQTQAMAFGTVIPLTEAEARAADLANQGQVNRAWEFWTSQVSI